jgi:hypothetical protein
MLTQIVHAVGGRLRTIASVWQAVMWLREIADLCKVYGCAADKVIGAIVKDRLPTKGRKA